MFGKGDSSNGSKANGSSFQYVFWHNLSWFVLTQKKLPPPPPPPPHPCGFSKNTSYKERAKPWFFVTFNIILTFPENFIEFPQIVQKR